MPRACVTDVQPEIKRLDHLPIIAQALARLRVREIVDEIVPVDPRSLVTTGQCVEALITSILLGKHTLYRVDELLESFDLELAFGRPELQLTGEGSVMEASYFNDERLAKALDDLFTAGAPTVTSRVVLQAVEAYELDLSRVHADTTTVKTFGQYAGSVEPSDPEDPQAIPRVTYGFSKDHRPDLKQIVYGLAVTADGAVPIVGRVSSGNRADALENRHLMQRLAETLPDPRGTTLVGDSKLFCGESLQKIDEYGFHYVTLVPRNVGFWAEVFERFQADRRKEEIPRLKVKGEGEEAREWRGRSYPVTYVHKDEATGVVREFPLRALVIDSDPLLDRKLPILHRRRLKELLSLEKASKQTEGKTYACEKDAESAAERVRKRGPQFHKLVVKVKEAERPAKREGPGRPRKDEPRETEKVWVLEVKFEPDEEAFDRALAEESCFVLATNLPAEGRGACSDQNLLSDYNDQDTVEGCFHWTKGKLHVAPIFLKTEARIAALGLVYVLALMAYALIQREVRARLVAKKTTIPSNKEWTDKPTTEVLFRLFENINTFRSGAIDAPVLITGLNTEQVRILELLGHDLLVRHGVSYVKPKVPLPGERAFKPRPRRARGKSQDEQS
jgi:transposase